MEVKMLGKALRLALLSFAVFGLQGHATSQAKGDAASQAKCVTSEPKTAAAPDEDHLNLAAIIHERRMI